MIRNFKSFFQFGNERVIKPYAFLGGATGFGVAFLDNRNPRDEFLQNFGMFTFTTSVGFSLGALFGLIHPVPIVCAMVSATGAGVYTIINK
jgi:hypothetical protein